MHNPWLKTNFSTGFEPLGYYIDFQFQGNEYIPMMFSNKGR